MGDVVLCGIDSSTTRTGISCYINGKFKDCVMVEARL